MSTSARIAESVTVSVLQNHVKGHPCCDKMTIKLYTDVLHSVIYEQRTKMLTWLAGTSLLFVVGGLIYKDISMTKRKAKRKLKRVHQDVSTQTNYTDNFEIETQTMFQEESDGETQNMSVSSECVSCVSDMEAEKIFEAEKSSEAERICSPFRSMSPISVASLGDYIELQEDDQEDDKDDNNEDHTNEDHTNEALIGKDHSNEQANDEDGNDKDDNDKDDKDTNNEDGNKAKTE